MTAPSNLIKSGYCPFNLAIQIIAIYRGISRKDAARVYESIIIPGKDEQAITVEGLISILKLAG